MGIMFICSNGYSQNFIYNGGFEEGDINGAALNALTPYKTSQYLDYWKRAKNTDNLPNHSPDWRYISNFSFGLNGSFDNINSLPVSFFAPEGLAMIGMGQAELIQQEINTSNIESSSQGILNPKLILSFNIRIPNHSQPLPSTKLSFYLSKNQLKYDSNDPCDGDDYREIGNWISKYTPICEFNNLSSNFPSGEWHSVTCEYSIPNNIASYDWFGIDLRSFEEGNDECATDEYIYLDDIKFIFGCEDGCSRTDGQHELQMTSNVIHNNSAVVIENTDNLTDLQFEVYLGNGALVYYNEVHCPNGITHPIYWDGTSIGGSPVANGLYKYRIIATNDCYSTEWTGSILKSIDYQGSNTSNFSQNCESGGNITPEECCLIDFYIDNETLVPPPYSKYIVQENIWACTQNPDFSDEVKVLNEANVLFQSGKQITLAEGFNTERGAVFLAQIKPRYCDNGENEGADSSTRFEENNSNADESTSCSKKLKNDIFLYPNPVNDIMTLSSSFESGEYHVLDLQGQVLLQGRISSKEQSIDLSNFNSGVYFLRIQNNQGKMYTKKIIKN